MPLLEYSLNPIIGLEHDCGEIVAQRSEARGKEREFHVPYLSGVVRKTDRMIKDERKCTESGSGAPGRKILDCMP